MAKQAVTAEQRPDWMKGRALNFVGALLVITWPSSSGYITEQVSC